MSMGVYLLQRDGRDPATAPTAHFGSIMAETIDELSIHYEEEGQILRKQLDKDVLTKGSWTTIMFLYQDLDRKTGEYGHHKVSIRRYQKREGSYLQRSKFEVSSPTQAKAVRDRIDAWFPDTEEDSKPAS
jgi:hypothetical protein